MKKKFYIEFIGMPASGKSFYKNQISKILRKKEIITNDYKDLSRMNKLMFFFIFIIKYFKLSIINLSFFYNNYSNKKELSKHFYYFKNEAALRIYHEIKNQNVINSEGFRHRSIYFIYENLKKNKKFQYKKYLQLLPKIDLLIYVRSNKKKNIQRSKKRKNAFKYNIKEIKNYEYKEKILESIVEETKKKIYTIDLKQNRTTENLNRLKKIIKKI